MIEKDKKYYYVIESEVIGDVDERIILIIFEYEVTDKDIDDEVNKMADKKEKYEVIKRIYIDGVYIDMDFKTISYLSTKIDVKADMCKKGYYLKFCFGNSIVYIDKNVTAKEIQNRDYVLDVNMYNRAKRIYKILVDVVKTIRDFRL